MRSGFFLNSTFSFLRIYTYIFVGHFSTKATIITNFTLDQRIAAGWHFVYLRISHRFDTITSSAEASLYGSFLSDPLPYRTAAAPNFGSVFGAHSRSPMTTVELSAAAADAPAEDGEVVLSCDLSVRGATD